MEGKQKHTLAIFDFDKTITAKHTFIKFLQFISGKPYFLTVLLSLIPQIILYVFKYISLMELREKVIYKFYKGLDEKKYKIYCYTFTKYYINKWLLKEAIEKIKWHKSQNHQLVLLSNSPEDYLKIWAEQFDFNWVMGSRFEFLNGVGTGRLKGEHCFGIEKVNRLKKTIPNLEEYYVYGYGDSKGDEQFLELSNVAYYQYFDLNKIYIHNE